MKKMKKIILSITFMFLSSFVFSQTDEAEYEKVLEQSPFNKMYPQFMAKEAADYFKEFNKLFTEEGPIAPKEARLVLILNKSIALVLSSLEKMLNENKIE